MQTTTLPIPFMHYLIETPNLRFCLLLFGNSTLTASQCLPNVPIRAVGQFSTHVVPVIPDLSALPGQHDDLTKNIDKHMSELSSVDDTVMSDCPGTSVVLAFP